MSQQAINVAPHVGCGCTICLVAAGVLRPTEYVVGPPYGLTNAVPAITLREIPLQSVDQTAQNRPHFEGK